MGVKMKIAVVDDEGKWREKACKCIRANISEKDTRIDRYSSGIEFLHQKQKYEIVFVDVEMPEMDGFSVVKECQRENPDSILIILTMHTELSRKGYVVNAFRYIDKLEMETEIKEALFSAEKRLQRNKMISVNAVNLGKLQLVIKDFMYIETVKRNVQIHTIDNQYICRENMNDMEKILEKAGFFRCHKSYIVNLDAIQKIDHSQVNLINGEKVYVSSRKYQELKKRYLYRKYEYANS